MNTNGRKQVRYIHISARLATIMQPNGTMQTVVARPGSTFNVGRNAEKRAARRQQKEIRRDDVKGITPLLVAYFGSEPKRIKSALTINMLSDRRMRQRGGEGYATRTAEAA